MNPIPHELIRRCLDTYRERGSDSEAESVLADWAEESGFGGLAVDLRDESLNVRWSRLAEFARMLDPDWRTRTYDSIEQAQKAAREAQEERMRQGRSYVGEALSHNASVHRALSDEMSTHRMLLREHHENQARRADVYAAALRIFESLGFPEVPAVVDAAVAVEDVVEDTRSNNNERPAKRRKVRR